MNDDEIDDAWPWPRAPRRVIAAKHLSSDGAYQWMDDAACSLESSHVFDILHGHRNANVAAQRAAAAVCAQCPVINQCRDYSRGMATLNHDLVIAGRVV